jgi:SpoVK/Ycf46/Vps4 family AAA+-type ATPase
MNLHEALCDVNFQVVIFEKADELFQNTQRGVGTTGSVQRLTGVALKALDERRQCERPFLAILEVDDVESLHERVVRRAKHVRLTGKLDSEAQRRLFARLGRVDELVDLTVSRSGAECERMVREAGVRAVRRAIEQGIDEDLKLEKQDFH